MGILFLLALILSMFVNQAPFNLVSIFFGVFSIFSIFKYKKQSLTILKPLKKFLFLIIIYFILFTLINFYHFGFNEDFVYAMRRLRWCLYAILFIPSISILFSNFTKLQENKKLKIIKYFYLISSSLFILIFLDSLGKLFWDKSYLAIYLKSANTIYQGKRASWTYNPIPFSKLMFFACCLNTFFYLIFKKIKHNMYAYSAALLLILNFTTFILTQTRASWLSLLLVLPCLFLFRKFAKISINKTVVLLLMFSLLIILNIKPNFISKRFSSIYSLNNFSNTYRIEHWKANIALSLDNKILGAGYAANRNPEVIDPYLKKFTGNTKKLYGHPHSEYLDILAGLGFPSFIIFCFIMLYPFVKNFLLLLKINGNHEKLFETRILVLCLCIQLFTLFTSFFDKINHTTWAIILINWSVLFYISNIISINTKDTQEIKII